MDIYGIGFTGVNTEDLRVKLLPQSPLVRWANGLQLRDDALCLTSKPLLSHSTVTRLAAGVPTAQGKLSKGHPRRKDIQKQKGI